MHRDIKPANVLLGVERPFLIDFGIARTVRDPRHTRTGTVIGTPGFLAPEQATGAVAGAAADVFSLAAVLVYAATGRSPFLADGEELDLPALLYRIVHDEPRLDGVPQPLRSLVAECMAKDPQRRPSAEEVSARLGGGPEQAWDAATPEALAAEVGRREAGLRQLLDLPQPTEVPPRSRGSRDCRGGQPSPAPLPGAASVPPPFPGALAGPGTPPYSPVAPGRGTVRAVLRSRGAGAAVGAAAVAAAVALAVWLPGQGGGGRGAASPGPHRRPPHPHRPRPHSRRVRQGRCRPLGPARGPVPVPERRRRTVCPGHGRVSSP